MKCSHCKTDISKDSVFCEFCGRKVKLSKEEKEQAKLERQKIREENRRIKLEDLIKTINENRRRNLEHYRQNADIISGVQILADKNRGCENCLKHDGEIYSLDNASDLPIGNCTNDCGYCRCTYISILKGIPRR